MKELAGSFIKTNIDSQAIVTVMRVETSSNLRETKIFVSVFPEKEEKNILEELKRKTYDFIKDTKPRLKIKFLPTFFFEIDRSAKMERKIEEILKTQ